MISDTGIWTIIINLIALAFAVQYSRSETFGEALLWLVWDFTGLRFVWEKIHPLTEQKPEGYRPPATIAVWIFGLLSLYIALFGLASQRYENAVDKIENRMNAFITQLVVTSPEIRRETFAEIAEIQSMPCPLKPKLLSPSSVFMSLVLDDVYEETIPVLSRSVEKYKDNLAGCNFDFANLSHIELVGANLRGASFWKATLVGTTLKGANMIDADLTGANLSDSNMSTANLENATLDASNLERVRLNGANLKKSRLIGANLSEASLKSANLENAFLIGANLSKSSLSGANLKQANLHGANIEMHSL